MRRRNVAGNRKRANRTKASLCLKAGYIQGTSEIDLTIRRIPACIAHACCICCMHHADQDSIPVLRKRIGMAQDLLQLGAKLHPNSIKARQIDQLCQVPNCIHIYKTHLLAQQHQLRALPLFPLPMQYSL